jgi:hypothetical protein
MIYILAELDLDLQAVARQSRRKRKSIRNTYSECCSWPWPSMVNEQLDVLHDRNQVILNLYPPQAAPPRSFQTESCSVSKRSFHKVPTDLNISF